LVSTVAAKQTETEMIVLAIDQWRQHYLYQYRYQEEGWKPIGLLVEGHMVRTTNTDITIPKVIAEEVTSSSP
jgi:hypothetical protein